MKRNGREKGRVDERFSFVSSFHSFHFQFQRIPWKQREEVKTGWLGGSSLLWASCLGLCPRHNPNKRQSIRQAILPTIPHQPQSTNFLQLSHSQRERLKRKFSLIDGLRKRIIPLNNPKSSIISLFLLVSWLDSFNYCYNIILFQQFKSNSIFSFQSN